MLLAASGLFAQLSRIFSHALHVRLASHFPFCDLLSFSRVSVAQGIPSVPFSYPTLSFSVVPPLSLACVHANMVPAHLHSTSGLCPILLSKPFERLSIFRVEDCVLKHFFRALERYRQAKSNCKGRRT